MFRTIEDGPALFGSDGTEGGALSDKLRTGVFKFTCCAGCQFQLIYFQRNDLLLEMLELADFIYFPLALRKEPSEMTVKEPFDLALIEGAISTPHELAELKKIRALAKTLVTFGACASYGGIPSLKDYQPERVIEERVYADPQEVTSFKVSPLDEFVKVDYHLAGCPPDRFQIIELFRALAAGTEPYIREDPVCVECKLRGNVCVLIRRQGIQEGMCMGPVTRAGCGAVCPTNWRACYGCWGPMSNPNVEEMVDVFRLKGIADKDIEQRFTKFAGLTPTFAEGARIARTHTPEKRREQLSHAPPPPWLES